MTWALCLSCGAIKFGALCPCSGCGVSTCGDMDLDILFSDHYLARSSLEELGTIIEVLCHASGDPELRFAAFLHLMAQQPPQFLQGSFTPEGQREIEALLEGLELPQVTLRKAKAFAGWSASARSDMDLPEPELPGGNGSGQPA